MITFLLLIVLVSGVTFHANRWKRDLRVEMVRVHGCRILSEKEVVSLARIPVGVPLYDVDLMKVRERLRANAYIRDAVVVHDLPSSIMITIQERTPVAVLGGTELFYVDEEGVVLPPVNSREILDVPVITGLSHHNRLKPGMKIQSDDFRVAMEILMSAASLEREGGSDVEIYHLISEIHIGGPDPTIYTAEHGIPVLFARENIEQQLLYLQSFWDQYVRQQGSEQVSSIDLRFDGQVVVRWNKTASSGESS